MSPPFSHRCFARRVQPLREKYFPSVFRKFVFYRSIPRSPGGAARDRHDSLARDAMDAVVPQDVRCVADGQVAWSWSPDAGTNFRVKSPEGRRLTSPVLRREREVSRKPLRRECRVISAYLCWPACVFFVLHARQWVRPCTRHSLRPLVSEGHHRCKTRAEFVPRERGAMLSTTSATRARPSLRPEALHPARDRRSRESVQPPASWF
jgi:hypothetical protein